MIIDRGGAKTRNSYTKSTVIVFSLPSIAATCTLLLFLAIANLTFGAAGRFQSGLFTTFGFLSLIGLLTSPVSAIVFVAVCILRKNILALKWKTLLFTSLSLAFACLNWYALTQFMHGIEGR